MVNLFHQQASLLNYGKSYTMIKSTLSRPMLLSALLAFMPATVSATELAILPHSVTNNAVAQVNVDDHWYLLSFSGLGKMKGYQDVHNRTYVYDVSKSQWHEKTSVPIKQPTNGLIGRLASVATALNDVAYVFGGYTVAQDHSEVSVPDVYAYHVLEDKFKTLTPMPVPVDDSIALPYNSRYIYLVSGWHNDGNVNLVQLYDSKSNQWQQASPFPGKAVFGHAGGIIDNKLLVCDGVRIDVHLNERRSYAAEVACYRGEIDPKNPSKISWFKVQHPTGTSRYRMAAKGLINPITQAKEIVFVGGSDNPYNYNGIGYNTKPSTPSNEIWRYNIDTNTWQISHSKTATMDHRGLLVLDGELITIGGMAKNQRVLKSINHY